MDTRYLEIDQRSEQLNELQERHPERARDFQAKLDMSLIYHENALEGIVFTGTELLSALDPLALPPDASLLQIFTEIRNHKAAIDFIRAEASNKKSKLSVALIKKLYEILGAGFEGRQKAVFRKEMPLHRTYFHDIAQPSKISGLLDKLVEYTLSPDCRESHPIAQAASVQWQFMQTFPFTENNGKIARLLSHLVLLHHDYLPAIIHAIDRQRYYESLRLPVAGLRQLLVEAMENSLENAFKVLEHGVDRSRRRRASGV